MSRLITFGCSNTYGEGLPDCWVNNQVGPYPSKFAWPQLTADSLNLECINLSVPGTSNKQICNDILNTDFIQSDIVVIMWTYFTRTCFFQHNAESKRILVQDITNNFFSSERKKYNTTYYRTFYTETNSIIENYMYINLSRYMLNKKGIKNFHVSCDEDQSSYSDFKIPSESISSTLPRWNCVDLNIFNLNSIFLDRALDGMHPGFETHKKASEEIKKYIDKTNC